MDEATELPGPGLLADAVLSLLLEPATGRILWTEVSRERQNSKSREVFTSPSPEMYSAI